MAAVQPPGPGVAGVDDTLARRRHGMTVGQALFDLLFGVAAPPLVLWADPGLFLVIHDVPGAPAPALAPYWALVSYVAGGCVALLLALWVLTGARRRVLGLLVVGPLACGLALSVGLGWKLLWPALGFGAHVKGILALTPWLTAFVLARHGLRALRAGADISVPAAAVSLIVGTALLLGIFSFAVKLRHRRARILTDQLLSRSADDHRYALSEMLRTKAYDPTEIAIEYTRLARRDPRRERLEFAYETLTAGETLTTALVRLGLGEHAPGPPPIAPD